jgi:hypothetical protein
MAIHVDRHTDRMTLEAPPGNGRPVGWTFRDIGESSVVVDADDRGHLRLELDRLGVHRTGEGPYTIELNGRTAHATIKSIDTPLTLIRTVSPSLEDAYLEPEDDESSWEPGLAP